MASPSQPTASQPNAFRERIAALKNLPRVMRLVWHAAPGVVTAGLLLRLVAALTPLGILAVSSRIIQAVVDAAKAPGKVSTPEIWILLGLEFLLAGGGLMLGRAIDYFDARLADEFGRDVNLRLMKHAADLDLAMFEDPEFYNKLERARAQATDRISMLTSLGSLFQRSIALVSLGAGVIYYDPWLFLLLLICVLPAFAGETHFAFLGYSLAHRLTPIRRELDYLRVLGSSRESAKEIKMFGLADHLTGRYETLSRQVIHDNQKLTRRRLRWGVLLSIIGSLGYYGGYAYIVWEAFEGRISVRALTFLAGAIAGANVELQTLFSLFSSISEQASLPHRPAGVLRRPAVDSIQAGRAARAASDS